MTSSSSLLSNAEEQQEHKKPSITTIIKIYPEYSKLINPLSKLEYELLKESMSNKGLHLLIIVNRDNVILDEHNRLKICPELGTEPQFKVKEFQDLSLIPINYVPFL